MRRRPRPDRLVPMSQVRARQVEKDSSTYRARLKPPLQRRRSGRKNGSLGHGSLGPSPVLADDRTFASEATTWRLTCIRLPNAGSKPDKSCNLTLLGFSSENCRKQFYAREFPTSAPVFLGVLGNKSRNLTPRRAARTLLFDGLAFGRRHSLRERRPREVEVVTVATSGRRPVTGRCQFPSRFSDCFWASWTRLRSGTAESIGTMSIGEPSTK